MSDKYLDDDEMAMLAGLFREQCSSPEATLAITMDAALHALLTQACSLELRVDLHDTVLHFPVQAGVLPADADGARLTTPQILSDGHHPRAWRLPSPQGLTLTYRNGKTVAADIQDLSVNGMRLLSRRCLFTNKQKRQVLLKLDQKQKIPLDIELVRQHKGNQFWLTSVSYHLAMTERLALSEFVFKGFMDKWVKQRSRPDGAASE
ncbi:PilZ domain-containing protein [Oceanimonas baumannii]|uniref:PilZ domain-containing protein n=1 Tax=Oceanimonas baumannii TaxID=129578 RepID=A0A235CNG5_9GAMM|nr:PilZ domain-containing protein [Oceanimonas baumannii]OYD26111.1 hypothetical protein B6S09_00555 [Oceanimonas baumannii]TDW62244.1 PilZ domain-containing protein [Oceanimonas baumannii]